MAPNTSDTVDEALRTTFARVLADSQILPEEKRMVAYDAATAADMVGYYKEKFVKRLDARRAKKTSAAPASPAPAPTVVVPELNPAGFNFNKINPAEVLFERNLGGKPYKVITNKFPVASNHMLLVAADLRAQVLTYADLVAMNELHAVSSFNVLFNSWSAGSSVNHFHVHLTDEVLPVLMYPIHEVQTRSPYRVYAAKNYPARHAVYRSQDVNAVWRLVSSMQASNQPHNLVFAQGYTYVFPRHADPHRRGKDLYGEVCGAFEMAGWFTLFQEGAFQSFTPHMMAAVLLSVTQCPMEPALEEVFSMTFRPAVTPPSIQRSVSVDFRNLPAPLRLSIRSIN